MTAPTLADSVAGHRAKELAALADSIAVRADAMADRMEPRDLQGVRDRAAFVKQAGYAEGVRDVLLWLTDDAPADMLTDVLDITPEEA